jgi:glycosyltransferase involved in cell wall biosynthesis
MKSVAIVSPSFHPMIGGVEGYVLGVGSELAKSGLDVHVYTPRRVFGRDCGSAEETVSGISVHRITVPFELSYRIKVWPGLMEAIQSRSHDLVHVYSHDSYAGFALLAARRMSVPFAVTTYGPFETHSDYGRLKAQAFRFYDAVVTPQILGRASAVFIRYPALEEWVESFGLSPDRIHLEPSGIPKNSLGLRNSRKLRARLGDGPIILYLGRISPQKGVQFAVESMALVAKKFPNSKLVLIGPDYIGYSRELLAEAARMGVTDSLVLMDPIYDEDAQLEAISECDAFVMPSSFEGFSQAVMKAMAQGKPVVVTNVGGLPYEVEFGRCGVICDYGNPQALAECLLGVLSGINETFEMERRAQARAQSFTFDVLAARLAEQYSNIAG